MTIRGRAIHARLISIQVLDLPLLRPGAGSCAEQWTKLRDQAPTSPRQTSSPGSVKEVSAHVASTMHEVSISKGDMDWCMMPGSGQSDSSMLCLYGKA
eukprot:scaffold375950_cov41-Prasinocladus_malaysianus.AAC.1